LTGPQSVSGAAEFLVHVNAQGRVRRVEIDSLPGSGDEPSIPDIGRIRQLLETSIREAVMTWRYTPAHRGEPVRCWGSVRINYEGR
jgi:hypothetical protein